MEDKEAKVKSWEKPWTTDEIRDQSSRWNLAGDAGLLKTLEQFAEDLTTRSNVTLKKLNTLVNDLEQTSSDVSNVTNTFLLLANKQFFENRVKDDDDPADVQKAEDKRAADEKAKPEPQTDPKERVRDALTKGMEFLDTMFSSVELVVGSDSEEEEDSLTSAGHLLKPINPYTSRPLPCLIGSREFFEDDHVGLRAQSDEDEESGELDEDESVQSSDSEEENNQALPPDLLQRKKISTPSESENSQPESEQSGVPDKKKHHSDQMFGQESPPEAEVSSVPTQNTAQKSFAAELAAKLGGVAAADNKTTVNVAQNSSRPPAAKEKPDIYAQTRKHFDDLFGPSSDDEDDSLFGSGGKYSGGRGLFDDDDVEDWKKPPPAKNLWEEPAEVSKPKDVPSKVPALAVENPSSLFDGEDADHSIFSSPSMSNSTRARNRADSSVSEVKTSTPNQEGDSLFGLINDFQNLSAIHAVPRPQSDQSGAKDSGLQSDFSGQTTFKKPAGGVSIFGNMAVNASMLAGKLQSTSSKEATAENNVAVIVSGSSTSGVDSNTASKSIKSVSGNSSAGPPQARDPLPQASKANVKDDDDPIDNLFKKVTANAQSSQSNGTGKSTTSTTAMAKKTLSLFDDLDSEDDDLLFSSTGSTGSRSRQSIDILESRKSQFPIMPKKNIFDDEDLLFGGEVGGGSSSDFDIFGAKGDAGKSKVGIDSVPDKGNKSILKGDSLEVGGGSDFDLFGAKTEVGKSKVSIDAIPDKSSKSVVKGDSLAGLLEADGGSDFDIFGAKSEAGKKKVAVDTVPDKSKKGDSLAGSLGNGSNPTLPSSENIGKKSGKDSKLDDLSWLDDADTGDIFSDLNAKAEQPPTTACKEPTLHSDLFSDKLFDNIADEGDGFWPSAVTPKPRTNTAVPKVEQSAPEPAKLSEKPAEKPKPVAVARTVAAPKKVAQENLAPSEKPTKGEKPTVAPRKTGTAAAAAKLEVEKPNEGRESPGLFEGSAGLSQQESNSNAKHGSSAKQFDEDEGDLFKISPAVPAARPPVKPEPPKTLNIRQTADVGSASLDADDLFNDGPLRGDATTTTVVPPETVGALPTTQRKPALIGGDTTDGSALRGPTDLRGNRETLLAAANVVEKSDAPSEPLRPSPKLKLNIDPLALLPGAKPPTRAERMEKAANFDGPAPDSVATLPSAGKDRVKIQVKRRPQTRRARQEAIRASLIENEDGSFGGDDIVPAAASEESPVKEPPVPVAETVPKTSLLVTEPEDKSPPSEDLPRERSLNNPKLLLPSSNPLSPSTDEEDFFGVPPDLPSDYGNPKDCNGNLFGDAPVLSPLDLGSVRTFTTDRSGEDLFATTSGDDNRNTLGSKMVSAAPPPGSLFDATENGNLGDTQKRSTEDDPLPAEQPPNNGAESFDDIPDLFGEKVPARTTSKTLQDLFPTVKKESAVKDEDNSLFRGANNVTKTQPPRLFSGSDEEDYEDLFSLEKPQTRRTNTDKAKEAKPAPNLFADPPSKSSNNLPKTNNPLKGADSVPNSKAGVRGPEGIFTSALPKTSQPKGADSVPNSKAGVRGPEGIFASTLPPEKEKIFSNDHLNGGGQPVHKKKTKAAPIIPTSNLDDDNLFPTNSAAYPSSKSSLGATGKGGAKKGASLFGDDSPESEDLFGSVSSSSSSSKKAPPPTKVAANSESSRSVQPTKPANKMQRSIFDDDDDEDIFSKASSKSSSSSNISQSFLGASADPYDLFANVPTSRTAGKAQKQQGGGTSSRVKVNEKEDVFEDPLMALKK